ncbi:hypothetical protein CEXT_123131 [Caerostris extrusa]|uniref:Uncharacterized protein n=1 Tax=Caerostris extrusa TaxID=172846 RepID=A0AAV4XY91_CAEEX|nr:hypothetical protein CEXT_123131 [Caerostris extrusa]
MPPQTILPLLPIPFNFLPPCILDSIKALMHLQAVSLLKLLPVSGTRSTQWDFETSPSMAVSLIFKWEASQIMRLLFPNEVGGTPVM